MTPKLKLICFLSLAFVISLIMTGLAAAKPTGPVSMGTISDDTTLSKTSVYRIQDVSRDVTINCYITVSTTSNSISCIQVKP